MQEIKVCRSCGKLINYNGYGPALCPQCAAEEDKLFRKVRNYIYNHPDAKLADTAEACGVKKALIQQWCKEERLQYSNTNATGLYCRTCKKQIRSGEYCDKCLALHLRRLNMMKNSTTSKKNTGSMYFLVKKN